MNSTWWDRVEAAYRRELRPYRWLRFALASLLRRPIPPAILNAYRGDERCVELLVETNDQILASYTEHLVNYREWAFENEVLNFPRPRSLKFPLPSPVP